jgi:predicted transposase YdaD
VLHIAANSGINKREKHMFDLALKQKWDNENKLDYATEQGILKGREEERKKNQQRLNGIVHYFHTQGKSVDEIASITQLSKQEVEEIIQLIV